MARSIPTDSILNADKQPEFTENEKKLDLPSLPDAKTVCVNRRRLVKLLSELTGDYIVLRVENDFPLLLTGLIGEHIAAAAIAPRIENE